MKRSLCGQFLLQQTPNKLATWNLASHTTCVSLVPSMSGVHGASLLPVTAASTAELVGNLGMSRGGKYQRRKWVSPALSASGSDLFLNLKCRASGAPVCSCSDAPWCSCTWYGSVFVSSCSRMYSVRNLL